MKLLLLLLLPLTTFAQLGVNLSAGYTTLPVAKVGVEYKRGHSSIMATGIFHATNRADRKDIAAISYGYTWRSLQPYVGISTAGFVAGINTYLGQNYTAGVGMYGKLFVITVGVTSLGDDKDRFLKGNDIAIIASQLSAGFFRGWNEAIKSGHWGTGKFWDDEISWKNKYKDYDGGDLRAAFPGSKGIFVFATDGYHLTNFGQNVSNLTTAVFMLGSKDGRNWKTITKKIIIAAASNAVAFNLSYNQIFKW